MQQAHAQLYPRGFFFRLSVQQQMLLCRPSAGFEILFEQKESGLSDVQR